MSKDAWEKVDVKDFQRDVAKAAQESRSGEHRFVKRKRLPWMFCCGCGQVLLKNVTSEKARKAGCYK